MNILVLVKQTFDTEERIVLQGSQISEDGVRFVINPYDEYAVEEAIRLKEAGIAASVTVATLGPSRAEEALRTALAMGADEAILADDPAFFGDEFTAAEVLAAVAKQGDYKLILAGNQAIDDGSSQIAVRLAELLEYAHISTLTKLEIDGDDVVGHRDAEGDEEIVGGKLPLVATAQQGLNDPRYPSLIGIRKAGKKPLKRVSLEDLGLHPSAIMAKTQVVETFLPPTKEAGKILTGELADQVDALVHALKTVDKVVE